jgi:hypothetical protein
VQVESLEPATAQKLLSFVENGGRIFCLDVYPDKSLGWSNYQQRDGEVKAAVEKMKTYADRFILLNKPEKEFIQWYKNIQTKYNITPYVQISKPDRFVTQVRYQAKGTEILHFINSSIDDAHPIEISPNEQITKGKQAWIWDAETGERYKLDNSNKITLDLGPADSVLIVFDNNKKGKSWKPKPSNNNNVATVNNWAVEFQHLNGSNKKTEMTVLKDLKEIPEFVSFSGTAIYRGTLNVTDKSQVECLNLGKVHGISELIINGKSLGVQWYGRRIYAVKDAIQNGNNTIEIKVITTMGNYMKTLKDNAVAQYWTNEKRKDQPIQSMGLIGPITIA